MKKLILLLLFFFPIFIFGQIDIDETTEKKINAIPYDGSYMTLPYSVSDEMGLGLVGEKVTLLDVSYFDMKNENGESVSYSDADNFKNKTYEIIAFEKDWYPILTIKSNLGSYKWKVTSTSKYIFNKFLDTIKNKLINKIYYPLHNSKEVEVLDGTKVSLDGAKEYIITKVSFTKFDYDYGIKVKLNDEFELQYPTGEYDQPSIFVEGKGRVPAEGWINLKGDSMGALDNTFIEEDIFKKFKADNSNYIEMIRKETVSVGMTEQQCRWAWGMPSKSYGALVGYDVVYDWGGKTLYFKSDKLALIK